MEDRQFFDFGFWIWDFGFLTDVRRDTLGPPLRRGGKEFHRNSDADSKSLCAILRQDRNNTSHRKPWRACSLAYASGYQTRSFREAVARRVSEGARGASRDGRRIAHGDLDAIREITRRVYEKTLKAGFLIHCPPGSFFSQPLSGQLAVVSGDGSGG